MHLSESGLKSYKRTGFTAVELMIAVTIFAIVSYIAFATLSGFRKQSIKGTSMLDSTTVLNDIYNSIQQDMLQARSFEVRDASNNLVQPRPASFFESATAAHENLNSRLTITFSQGDKIKYYQDGSSLIREEAVKKNLGENRIKKVSFCPTKSLSEGGETLFELLLVEIEVQPSTDRTDEQHKTLKLSFFVTPPL
ncbi:MAG: hypothetical protein GQF41_4557 [Candidatus Rifleibacterium amylolyticum]|nr:MAG: hypothetical protein GQF41_4557 [Candidatus Rifleibacterium amylolyticum]